MIKLVIILLMLFNAEAFIFSCGNLIKNTRCIDQRISDGYLKIHVEAECTAHDLPLQADFKSNLKQLKEYADDNRLFLKIYCKIDEFSPEVIGLLLDLELLGPTDPKLVFSIAKNNMDVLRDPDYDDHHSSDSD